VHGPSWWRARVVNDKATIRPLYGVEYVKALLAAKVCLCFLSKVNKNEAAGRTFEIPAVGGFLLAERTEEQTSYFREGVEADFFSSAEELVRKARYYLDHDDERSAIARAGHCRCLKSPYTHRDRMREVLEAIV
jgi:spore maturation protein CgeB